MSERQFQAVYLKIKEMEKEREYKSIQNHVT